MRQLKKNKDFSILFISKFTEFTKSGCHNGAYYEWILKNSTRMQRMLGTQGIMEYKPAYSNYVMHNYPIIINLIPAIVQRYDSFSSLFNRNFTSLVNPIDDEIRTIKETILRYIGDTEENYSIFISYIKNPFKLFADGLFSVLNIPMHVIYSMGLISSKIFYIIKESTIYKLLLFILFLIAIYSDIITVSQGHSSFFNTAVSWIKDVFTNP